MSGTDQALIAIAQEALDAGRTVMVAVRDLQAMLILAIQSLPDGELLTLACPASFELGIGPSQTTIRASDLIGVSVFD